MALTAIDVKRRNKNLILRIPGVTGIGVSPSTTSSLGYSLQGEKEFINIYVERITPEIEEAIPKELEGFPVRLIETGIIEAFSHINRRSKIRPARPGISMANFIISGGTFGAVVIDKETGKLGMLSNAHIFADEPRQDFNDTEIVQPGRVSGGTIADDLIGHLTRWIPLNRNGLNRVDCALAIPLSPDLIDSDIIDLGFVTGTESAEVGMQVVKSGRTTEITNGEVIDVNADFFVNYKDSDPTKTIQIEFTDQIVTGEMSSPGDSGSLLLNSANNKAVGLLYAGSSTITIYSKIENVMADLNISMVTEEPVSEGRAEIIESIFPSTASEFTEFNLRLDWGNFGESKDTIFARLFNTTTNQMIFESVSEIEVNTGSSFNQLVFMENSALSFKFEVGHIELGNEVIDDFREFTVQPVLVQASLIIETVPISGPVFIDNVFIGVSPQEVLLSPGPYIISFGAVEGFITPPSQSVSLLGDETIEIFAEYIIGEEPRGFTPLLIGMGLVGAAIVVSSSKKVR